MQISRDTLPNYHFLLIATNITPDWFFVAARRYWERFLPTVVSDVELIRLVPPQQSVAVSILARRDVFERLAVEASVARADALIDALLFDTVQAAQTELERRAAQNAPFGVPLIPTAVPSPRPTILPTPGSILGGESAPAPNLSGFVTLAPTNPSTAGFITQTPTPTPNEPAAPDGGPIVPTPGAISGG